MPPSPPVPITHYEWPRDPPLRRAILLSAALMLLSSRRELLQPGSPLHALVLAGHPVAQRRALLVQAGIFYFLWGVHALETVFFAWARLRPHGVPLASAVGLRWLATVFVGGKFGLDHFAAVVAAAQEGRGKGE